jgi:PAS domain S-box-containing protein
VQTGSSRLRWNLAKLNSHYGTVVLVCLVAVLSYLAPRLAAALLLHPQTVWPLWPGCALLVSVLLLVRQSIWPIVIPAAIGAFALFDVQAGVPIRSIAWFIPADTVQVLITALGLRYFFNGVPRLNSVSALVKYVFSAVLLAPAAGAFLGAMGIDGNFWKSWSICFFSEALAFVTLTPAILSWLSNGNAWVRKSRAGQLELAVLITGLVGLAYVTFTASESSTSPLLLSSLVPFLLWAALRFGSKGVSFAVIIVTCLSIWAAVHGRGPFVERGPVSNVLSLQLFLILAATPFMVLAALVEERKGAEGELRDSEARFRHAAQAGKMFAYEWDAETDVMVCSEQSAQIFGTGASMFITGQQILTKVHPDDRNRLAAAIAELHPEKPSLEISYRMVRPDGSVTWVERSSRAHFDAGGRIVRTIGMIADITERKRTEEALRESQERLGLAVKAGRMYAFEWDSATDVITRTGECDSIFNWMDDPTRVTGRQFVSSIHPADQEAYAAVQTALTPENPIYQTSYRVLRPDGSVVWLEANGQAFFDARGRRLRIVGMAADVTERKHAEEILSSVSRRLIEAQEQERARIARELHDDLSQRMALLQIELAQFEQDTPRLSHEASQQLHNITRVATEVSSDIHDLSHRLHPSKLGILGLVLSLDGLCREFSVQHNIQVRFVHDEIPRTFSKDITLCLFRIVQEALQNVAKHSGATDAIVELSVRDDQIELCVSDSGAGFSVECGKNVAGLGLVSMRERLRLIGGHLAIESEPSRGTRVHVRVPFSTDNSEVRDEGKVHKAEA